MNIKLSMNHNVCENIQTQFLSINMAVWDPLHKARWA